MAKIIKKTKYKEALKRLKQKNKKARPRPKTKTKPKSKSKPKPKHRPKIKPKLKTKPKLKPKPKSKARPKRRLKLKPRPKPKAKVKPRVKPKPKSKPRSKVRQRPKPRPKPKAKRKPKPKPRSKPKAKRKKIVRKVKPKSRPKPKKRVIKRKPAKKRRSVKSRPYIGKGVLDQLFESQAKVKLLRFFFRNIENVFEPKEIFKKLRSNTSFIRQEIKKLEKLGLLKQKKAWLTFEKKRGGIRKELKKVFYIDPSFDFFDELRRLVLKSAVTSKSDLADNARKVGNIRLLVLTGVFTGDETAKADLLIVGDKINQRKLSSFIKDLEAEVGKEVNCAVLTTKEFNYRYDMYDRFVRDLLNTKCEILIRKLELW